MRQVACLLCAALACAHACAGDEQDRYEEQAVARGAYPRAERAMQADQGERANTLRDLEAAFPGKLPKAEPGKNEKEAEAWFDLVAGGGDGWSKADAAAAGLGPMYERWTQRLQLGPVPSIKKDEFLRFAKTIINNSAAMVQGGGGGNTDNEADKAFRVLDLNSDGELTGVELTAGLRAGKGQADPSGDGRISKEEYRDYFRGRVDKKAETLAAALKANNKLMRDLGQDGLGRGGAGGAGGLPDWFTKLDPEKNGQVALFDWRKAGKPLAAFMEMDLNGDGLLTPDEYRRWVKMKEDNPKP